MNKKVTMVWAYTWPSVPHEPLEAKGGAGIKKTLLTNNWLAASRCVMVEWLVRLHPNLSEFGVGSIPAWGSKMPS